MEIPEDLRVQYKQAQNLNNYPGGWRDGKQIMELIERIAALCAQLEAADEIAKTIAGAHTIAVLRAETLEAQLSDMQKPVTIAELKKHGASGLCASAALNPVNRLIASHLPKPSQPEEPK